MVDSALQALEMMDWIGITEFIDACTPSLAEHVGSSPTAAVPVANVTMPSASATLSDRIVDVVADLTSADEVVYRRAVQLARQQNARYRREEHVRRWGALLESNAVDLDNVITVRADEQFAGSAWWPSGVDADGTVFRWSGWSDSATIDLPLRVRHGDTIELSIFTVVKPELLSRLSVEVNSRPVETVLDVTNGMRLIGTLPPGVERSWTTITIKCPTVPWRDVHPETEDWARYGMAFSSLRLSPGIG